VLGQVVDRRDIHSAILRMRSDGHIFMKLIGPPGITLSPDWPDPARRPEKRLQKTASSE
jgi:hypothetical protein